MAGVVGGGVANEPAIFREKSGTPQKNGENVCITNIFNKVVTRLFASFTPFLLFYCFFLVGVE